MQVGDKLFYQGNEMTISYVGELYATGVDADGRSVTNKKNFFKPAKVVRTALRNEFSVNSLKARKPKRENAAIATIIRYILDSGTGLMAYDMQKVKLFPGQSTVSATLPLMKKLGLISVLGEGITNTGTRAGLNWVTDSDAYRTALALALGNDAPAEPVAEAAVAATATE